MATANGVPPSAPLRVDTAPAYDFLQSIALLASAARAARLPLIRRGDAGWPRLSARSIH